MLHYKHIITYHILYYMRKASRAVDEVRWQLNPCPKPSFPASGQPARFQKHQSCLTPQCSDRKRRARGGRGLTRSPTAASSRQSWGHTRGSRVRTQPYVHSRVPPKPAFQLGTDGHTGPGQMRQEKAACLVPKAWVGVDTC